MTENTAPGGRALDGARFDWYAATVHDDEDSVIGRLTADLGAKVVNGQKLHGYERGYELVDENDERHVLARVLAGGRNGNPHVFGSGADTMPLVGSLRAAWPGRHRVTRVDSALDYDVAGVFDRLKRMCLAKADERRLSIDQKGDWERPGSPAGRTLYVGSVKSPSMVRLYEKGKQMRAIAPSAAAAEAISPDWVRLEMQLRPMRSAKLTAAAVDPVEVWGYSRWTGELLGEVEDYYPERVNMNPERESDDERAFRFMVKQYGAVLSRVKGDRSWAQMGEFIGARLVLEQSRNETCV